LINTLSKKYNILRGAGIALVVGMLTLSSCGEKDITSDRSHIDALRSYVNKTIDTRPLRVDTLDSDHRLIGRIELVDESTLFVYSLRTSTKLDSTLTLTQAYYDGKALVLDRQSGLYKSGEVPLGGLRSFATQELRELLTADNITRLEDEFKGELGESISFRASVVNNLVALVEVREPNTTTTYAYSRAGSRVSLPPPSIQPSATAPSCSHADPKVLCVGDK
jgi:hypothetical protein